VTRTEHLLTILAEECAEVAQRVSKALRFGLAEVQPGQEYTNAERIEFELTDLIAAAEMLIEDRVIADPDQNDILISEKKRKVEKFLKFSAGRGLVDDMQGDPATPHPEAK
jgi:NTP pyrophosphatase (non-canonical NTP hydrolase)